MKTLEEKIATRPGIPQTREEFDSWLRWHADPENRYAWDFNVTFEINGHTISTNSNQFGHIVVDHILQDVRDNFCMIVCNNINYKPTEYVKMKIFGEH
jgi:hypothetical protein